MNELDKEELIEQVVDLYTRFKNVKEFYDFSFNPNENKRVNDAKVRIAKEYFPDNGRRAKKRRSVAQKLITHLQKLEVEPVQIIDLMLYNLEIAQSYTAENYIKQESFYKSMLSSFRNAIVFIDRHGLQAEFTTRVEAILKTAEEQKWLNAEGFSLALNLKKE